MHYTVAEGQKGSKVPAYMASLLEKYLDADMGLADDITDRALQAHMAESDLKAAKGSNAEDGGEIHRLKSRDSTKELGQAIKQMGAAPKYYGLFNGGVNTVVTGMPTKQYREVQINLRPKEATKEAFTDSMLGMTGTINALVRDNLTNGTTASSSWQQAADVCRLNSNCFLAARKQQKLLQTEQPQAIECAACCKP